MEIKASINYLRISPRKVRLVASMIRGMDVGQIKLVLYHLPKRSARPLLKLLNSAIASAKHDFQLSEDDVYVKRILVNSGTAQKRYTPRAFGRAAPIRKRTSHVSLTLDTKDSAKKREGGQAGKGAPEVRDIAPEDIRDQFKEEPREEKPAAPQKPRSKPMNFVRRMFNRKAI